MDDSNKSVKRAKWFLSDLCNDERLDLLMLPELREKILLLMQYIDRTHCNLYLWVLRISLPSLILNIDKMHVWWDVIQIGREFYSLQCGAIVKVPGEILVTLAGNSIFSRLLPILESILLNFRQTCRQFNFFQREALLKRMIFNTRDPFWYSYLSQSVASGKKHIFRYFLE